MCLFGPVDICVALLCCSFATLMVYKIPMGDVISLAKAFSQLESGEWPENSIECLVYLNFGNFVFKDHPPPLPPLSLQLSKTSILKSTTFHSLLWSRLVEMHSAVINHNNLLQLEYFKYFFCIHICCGVRFSWNLLKNRRMRRMTWALLAPHSSGSGYRRMAERPSIILIVLCTSCEPALSALCLPLPSLCVSLQIVGAPVLGATAMRVCRSMELARALTRPT